ncbi:hypothetical protein [Streptomyces huiliensis]|uniref:hypothetical protein n=1 Tax=Streptomyces huiliensis TaxID=2876027 RepID=UPI001CBDEEBF|nr:hypothetical protein [Streptomyces huiliensis]MBZ4319399.1 hypothetical protein [Streptomyces huiliensis]
MTEVTTYRTRPISDQPAVEHIARIAPDALAVVEDALNHRIKGVLSVVVTDTFGIVRMGTRAEREAAHVVPTLWRRLTTHARRPVGPLYGRTAIAPGGLLVLINARPHHGDLAAVTTTLVHEFVHAVQLSRPGARTKRIAQLRAEYGLVPMSRAARRAADRAVDRDEVEAYALEPLADRL